MLNSIPIIEDLMNPIVESFDENLTVGELISLLHQKNYRHAPIMFGNGCTGLVSLAELYCHPRRVKVTSIANKAAPCVPHSARIDQVVDYMAQRHLDAVLVTKNEKLQGIVTTTDILRTFTDFLRYQWSDNEYVIEEAAK